nr:DUF2628 domain-containing protein [uncultured Gellertiella sp.]
MASYLVLTPQGTRGPTDAARFVRDGFSIFALVFPLLWMLAHRLWLPAALLFAIEAVIGYYAAQTGHDTGAALVLFALSLLIALESGQIRYRFLSGKGWQTGAIIPAGSLAEAEEIYFSGLSGTAPSSDPPLPVVAKAGPWGGMRHQGPALGLFDYGKGR